MSTLSATSAAVVGSSTTAADRLPAPTGPRRTLRTPPRPADLAVLGALLGIGALLGLPSWLSAPLLTGFIALAPGSAILSWVEIPVRARLGAIPTLGMSVMTIVTMGAMWSYRWDPDGILVVSIAGVLLSSALWYRRNGWPSRRTWSIRVPALASLRPSRSLNPSDQPSTGLTLAELHRSLNPSVALSLLALLLWAVSLPGLPGVDASLYGLLFSGTGPLLAVAIVATAVAFGLAIRSKDMRAAVLALAAALVVARFTTVLATEMPLYDWTYKHVAVVDYIQQHNLIMPSGTDIYAKWPAFFVAMAWFCDVTQLSPLTLAHVWAPVVHVLVAVVVYSAARTAGLAPRVAITAAFVVEIVNWVGQDYFSPQAWALILAFGLLLLLLASRECRAAGVLSLIPFVAMVPSHQLTPYWIMLTTGLLIVIKRVKPWWILGAMAAVAGGYLLLNIEAVAPYGLLSGTSPVKNAASNFGDAQGSAAKWFTSAVCRSLSAMVFLTALAGAWWLRKHGRPVLVPLILAFAPVLLLLGLSYGGEAIFRVYLYSLLGCGILIAPLLVWAIDRPARGRFPAIAAAGVSWLVIAALAGLNAFFALWPMIVETRAQIDVMKMITATARPGTRIMMVHPSGLPARVGEPYAELTLKYPDFDNPISLNLGGTKDEFPSAEQLSGLEWALDEHPFDTYVMFSEQSRRAIGYYNEYHPEGVAEFEKYLTTAPGWKMVYRNGETVIFRHQGSLKEWWKWQAPEKHDALGIGH